ncbi:MAG: hypothetical protein LBU58_05520 [Clostridiales bacterium]|jgi:hypothetical protein|nr:hypothetical protein [Clostridiales bacterium]
MKTLFMVLLGLFLGIFLIGGIFGLLGAIIGGVFALIGGVIGLVWKVLFTPAILVLIIVVLAYKLNKKSV